LTKTSGFGGVTSEAARPRIKKHLFL